MAAAASCSVVGVSVYSVQLWQDWHGRAGPDMTQAQGLFEQVSGEGVAEGRNRDLFFIPHSASNTFRAFWVMRLMGVAALRMRSGEPTGWETASGDSWLHHKARNAREVRSGSGTRRSWCPLPRRICTRLRCASISPTSSARVEPDQGRSNKWSAEDPATNRGAAPINCHFCQGENIRQRLNLGALIISSHVQSRFRTCLQKNCRPLRSTLTVLQEGDATSAAKRLPVARW